MSNPTTPFSWQMPTATDLVTDLPADFEVFGQAVATSMADLLGGTTGQVLSKTTNADMDFTWINNDQGDITGVTAGTGISGGGTSGTVTVTNDMATTITTAGDLIYGTGSGTYTRRGIGSTSQVLTVAGGVPTWATPASSGMAFIQKGTFTTASSVNVNTCFSSTYDNYRILVKVTGASVVNGEVRLRMRSATTDNTSANYNYQRLYAQSSTVGGSAATNQTSAIMGPQNTALTWFATDMWSPFLAENTGYVTVSSYNQTNIDNFSGAHKVASSFDGFTMFPDSGTITGEVWVYGYVK
jgi:hypothetical protein